LGTQAGTTNYELGVALVGDPRIDAYDTFPLAVQALIAGDVDAVLIDDVAGQGYVGVNADATKLLTDDLQSDPLGFIYPLDSDIIDAVNGVLADMDEDGTLANLISIWFIDFTG
jgi:polar amino acid transport system substrate-binding protein